MGFNFLFFFVRYVHFESFFFFFLAGVGLKSRNFTVMEVTVIDGHTHENVRLHVPLDTDRNIPNIHSHKFSSFLNCDVIILYCCDLIAEGGDCCFERHIIHVKQDVKGKMKKKNPIKQLWIEQQMTDSLFQKSELIITLICLNNRWPWYLYSLGNCVKYIFKFYFPPSYRQTNNCESTFYS